MLKIGNNILFEDYIKGFRVRPDCIKVYFIDRTAKCFYTLTEQQNLKEIIKDIDFIAIDSDYFNPYNIKGFELIEDEYTEDKYVKIYFPDNSAVTTNLDDDGFEELIIYFEGGQKE